MVNEQYAFLSCRTVTGRERIGRSVIYLLLLKLLCPFLPELFRIYGLITLKSRALNIRAVGYALKMDHHGLRLIYYPLPMLPDLKCQVAVLTVGRGIPLIKSADLLPELLPYHDGCSGDIIHLSYIVIFGLFRIIQTSIVPA